MKFLMIPRIWQHMAGFRFQAAAMYYMEARST
jgi:hypothetical protein